MNALLRRGFGFASGIILVLSVALCRPAAAEESGAAALASDSNIPVASTPLRAFSVASASAYFGRPASTSANADTFSSSTADAEELPEAPVPVGADVTLLQFGNQESKHHPGMAKRYALDIPSGLTAQQLTGGQKVLLGFHDLYAPSTFVGIALSAGYSHLTDGQPNFGVDGTAFAKRFGAGVARSSSQDIFYISVMSPLLHEDPRYYVQGPETGFFHRVVYAATRPLIGRTDSGHSTVNAALLIGYAGAAALTPAYYPQINHNFHDVASTFGASLGGEAIGFEFTEFTDQLLRAIHVKF